MTITRELGSMPLPEGTHRFLVMAGGRRAGDANNEGWNSGVVRHVRVLCAGGVGVILETEETPTDHLPTGSRLDVLVEADRLRVVFETDDALFTPRLSYIQRLSESGRALYGTIWRPEKEMQP